MRVPVLRLCIVSAIFTLVGCETCNVLRNVEVVVEISTRLKGKERFLHDWQVSNFIRSLQNQPKNSGCWQTHTRVVDSEIRPVNQQGTWTPVYISAETPEKNTLKLLKMISEETSFTPHLPQKVVVLVLSDNVPRNLESLENHAKKLQELNCIFVIINVGSSQLNNNQIKHFRKITRSDARIIPVTNFKDLSKSGPYFDPLRSLLNDPFHKFPKDSIVLSSLGPVRDRGIGLSRFHHWAKCGHPVDFGFLLDGSGSAVEEYGKQIGFVKGLVSAFGISEEGTHAGVIQYSKKARLSIKLNQYTDLASFLEALDALQPKGFTTRIDLALEVARDQLFAPENGSRDTKTTKLLILVTDGKQKQAPGSKRPDLIADDLRQQGINILVVGVGDGVDEMELTELSGPEDNWRRVHDFRELNSRGFIERMTRKTCDLALGRECTIIVDLCFIMDSSGSIDVETDYEKMKEFVIRIANSFELSEGGAHGSLVVFSDFVSEEEHKEYSKVTVYLKDNKTPTQFRRAVEESRYFGYRTRIDLGFQLAEKDVFNVRHGARPNVKKVIILLTDGEQYPVVDRQGDEYDPIQASQRLHDAGVLIYAVGIGTSLDKRQLQHITRSKDRVFYAHNFDTLESQQFVRNVSTTACRSVNRPGPGMWTPWGVPEDPDCETPTATPVCKGGCPVFHNIFNLNLGPSYVMNGMQLGAGKRGHVLDGQCTGNRCQSYKMDNMNIEQLMNVIKIAVGGMNKRNPQPRPRPRFRPRPQPQPQPRRARPGIERPGIEGPGTEPCSSPGLTGSLGNHLCTEAPFVGGVPSSSEGEGEKGRRVKPTFPTSLLLGLGGAPSLEEEGGVPLPLSEEASHFESSSFVRGPPAIVGPATRRHRRSRRSVGNVVENLDELKMLKKLSKIAGCGMFMRVLQKYRIFEKISKIRENGNHVTLFCPRDDSLLAMYGNPGLMSRDREVVMNMVAVKHDVYGTMYNTLAGGKITLVPTLSHNNNNNNNNNNNTTKWKANGVDVIVTVATDTGIEIAVTSDVIHPVTLNLLDALKENPDTSIFYNLLSESRLNDVFKTDVVSKICFTSDLCVPLTTSMSDHIKNVIEHKHFTVIAPTNAVFNDMSPSRLSELSENSDVRLKFLQQYVFLGSVWGSGAHPNELATSVSPLHMVVSSSTEDLGTSEGGMGTRLINYSDGQSFEVLSSEHVIEGLLHVVKPH